MNIAIILAGGNGTRLGGELPKQYIKVGDKPIISYCLEIFEKHKIIDKIIIVAGKDWMDFIEKEAIENKIFKFAGFALAGKSRQESILNGLDKAYELGAEEMDRVIIHDAARPNVTNKIITDCIVNLDFADGIMPVLPVTDTIYLSNDGKKINELLDREKLFAGQSPESFIFGKYYIINKNLSKEELSNVKGSSEIAYRYGMNIHCISGSEYNYKITTSKDLKKFIMEKEIQ